MDMVARRWRWPVVIAGTGTVLIGLGAFWLSFTALADLAARSGVPEGRAWVWPLLVDGLIVVATIAVFALDQLTGAWYAWTLLICGALVSVVANILHAFVAADATVPAVLAAVVAAVPPLVLLASTHLTVVLIRSTDPPPSGPLVTPEQLAPINLASSSPAEEITAAPQTLVGLSATEEEPAPAATSRPQGYARAVELRDRGWSNAAIARELGVHPSTIGRWLTRHLPDSPSGTPEDDHQEAATPQTSRPSAPVRPGQDDHVPINTQEGTPS